MAIIPIMEEVNGVGNEDEEDLDDCLAFNLLSSTSNLTFECEDDDVQEKPSENFDERICFLDDLFMERNIDGIRAYQESFSGCGLLGVVISMMLGTLEGKHVDVVLTGLQGLLCCEELLSVLRNEAAPGDSIQRLIVNYIAGASVGIWSSTSSGPGHRALGVLVLGYAYLELFCRANYTGPDLSDSELKPLSLNEQSFQAAIQQLECDGLYAYGSRLCQLPETLFLSRVLLATVADPNRKLWKHGIFLAQDGTICANMGSCSGSVAVACESASRLQSRCHRAARSAVTHARLLQDQRYSHLPTLWKESSDMFERTAEAYGVSGPVASTGQSLGTRVGLLSRVQCLLEWGLSQHIFEFGDKVSAVSE